MLAIEDLEKTYANGVYALQAVSLSIGKGMFGLLGPNGAGKSSLMRTIATLQDPDRGSVTFNEVDVVANPDYMRARMGYLPQEFGVYPRTSPLVFLEHIATLKGITDRRIRRQTVENLLTQTNLWDVRKKNMSTFSGGMKQRIGIAQALLGNPQLIIVDEPTAGLDPVERRRFHNLLAAIGEDVVVILSTHIVEDVAELCGQMAIMGGGRILRVGEPSALTAELAGRLWVCGVDDREHLQALRARHTVLSSRRVAGRLEVKVLADTCPDGFAAATPNLEDVYFATLAAAHLETDVE